MRPSSVLQKPGASRIGIPWTALSVRALEGAHSVAVSAIRGQRVLLLDDLYRSGATMNAITAALYDQGVVVDVYALAVTRTRSRS